MKNNLYLYFKHFDEVFKTNTIKYLKEMKLLQLIYENFEDYLYVPNEKYKKYNSKDIEIIKKLKQTLTKEQRELFEEHQNVYNNEMKEEEKQLFLFGYIIAIELQQEGRIHLKNKIYINQKHENTLE